MTVNDCSNNSHFTGDQISEQHVYRSCMFVTITTHKFVVLPAPDFQNLNFTVLYLSTFFRSVTENTPCRYFTNVELRFFFLVNAILGKKVAWNDGVTKCVTNFMKILQMVDEILNGIHTHTHTHMHTHTDTDIIKTHLDLIKRVESCTVINYRCLYIFSCYL